MAAAVTLAPSLVAALTFGGCHPDDSAEVAALAAARASALAEPAPVGPDFAPDLAVHLAPTTVARAIELGLDDLGPIDPTWPVGGGITVHPDLRVTRLAVTGPGTRCPPAGTRGGGCLAATAHLSGTVTTTSPLGSLAVPTEVEAALEAAVDTALDLKWIRVEARPIAVTGIDVRIDPGSGTLPVLDLPEALVERLRVAVERVVVAGPPRRIASL
ncbi:MAG: hypothetical protein ABMB14_31700, partial [Myxococcota bacterium]